MQSVVEEDGDHADAIVATGSEEADQEADADKIQIINEESRIYITNFY